MNKNIINNLKLNSKLDVLLNLIIFNIFLIGFVLNFIAYIGSSWILIEKDSFGLFEYCKISMQNIDLSLFDFKLQTFFKAKYKIKNLEIKDKKCFQWNSYNKPSKNFLIVFILF